MQIIDELKPYAINKISAHLSIKNDQSWNMFYFSHVITCIYIVITLFTYTRNPLPPAGIRGLFLDISRSAHPPTHCHHTLITSQNINHTNMRERFFFLGQNMKHVIIFY